MRSISDAHLLAVLLRQLAHLLLLRVGQVESSKRQAGARAARAEARSPSARAARLRTLRVGERAAADKRNDECAHTKNTKMTNHGYYLQ